MQLMPYTAKRVSKGLKLEYTKSKLTEDPKYNVILGSAYLDKLLSNYNGSYILSLAAYNAGESRVSRWIKKYGDPRKDDITSENWIELIPFKETRNYVQRVMENIQVYEFIENGLKNQDAVPTIKNTFLVYLAWEEQDQMIPILNTITGNEFIYYSSVDQEVQIANVTLKPFSNKHFKEDLIACNGLLTNAGFQLPAEAIYLGKKILCKPLAGQPEQEHNAKILKRLEHATVCAEFTKEEIEMWIQNGKQKKELYNESIDLMVEMIENPKKDFRSRISKLWI